MDQTPSPRPGQEHPPTDLQTSTRHDQGPVARGPAGKGAPALYFHSTFPRSAPRAVVAIVHGYFEHGGRYARLADAWAQKGVASVAIDLRGHGRAEGRRGYCNRFEEYVDDLSELTRLLREQAPGVPPFLFGHSFGGLVVTSRVLTDPGAWRGLVLSSPFFGLAVPVPLFKWVAGKIASRILPTVSLPSGLHGADVTRDGQVALAYDADPLVFHDANARWFTEAEAAQERAMVGASTLKIPLAAYAGTQDRVADVATTRSFFSAVSSEDKTFEAIEGGFHEVLNDPNWRVTADKIAGWVLARAN